MSILDMFRAAPSQQPAAPVTPTQPGGMPASPANTTGGTQAAPNGVIPAAGVAPTPDSPLAQFASLWETAPIDASKPAPNAPFSVNSEDVQKAVAKQDFSSYVTPETLAAIQQGGPEAAAAFMEAINATSRQVLAQSTMVSSKLTEQYIQDALKRQAETLPSQIRSQTVSSHMQDTNPLFSNPAIKPVIEATQAQLLAKFPAATPAEITKMTHDYINAMGASFAPPPAVNPNAPKDQDWSVFGV